MFIHFCLHDRTALFYPQHDSINLLENTVILNMCISLVMVFLHLFCLLCIFFYVDRHLYLLFINQFQLRIEEISSEMMNNSH
jgi:hypothetical protein